MQWSKFGFSEVGWSEVGLSEIVDRGGGPRKGMIFRRGGPLVGQEFTVRGQGDGVEGECCSSVLRSCFGVSECGVEGLESQHRCSLVAAASLPRPIPQYQQETRGFQVDVCCEVDRT